MEDSRFSLDRSRTARNTSLLSEGSLNILGLLLRNKLILESASLQLEWVPMHINCFGKLETEVREAIQTEICANRKIEWIYGT